MKAAYRDVYGWIKTAVIRIGWLPVAVFAFHQLAARVFDAYNVFPLRFLRLRQTLSMGQILLQNMQFDLP